MKLKLAAYVRCSTRGQIDDGFGLVTQREQIERWAKRNGYKVIAWHSDEAVSGMTDALDRDGLAAALQSVCNGDVDGVVVARLDRLARSLTVQEAALAHVWRCGGRVFTVDGGEVERDDPDDPMRSAMRKMVGVFSELERAMIIKRLRDGRRTKSARGGYAGGRPRFGTRAEDGVLVADKSEAKAARRMLQLHKRGMSLRQIASTLDAEGYKPRGKAWHPQAVKRIIERDQVAS